MKKQGENHVHVYYIWHQSRLFDLKTSRVEFYFKKIQLNTKNRRSTRMKSVKVRQGKLYMACMHNTACKFDVIQ